ncbi:hypothetical protein ACTZOI_27120 [Klebsiella pneumoniae]
MFKPISYLEIQLLSGVSGGYITKAYAILEVWSLLAAAGDTFPALIEKDRIYLLQLISGKNNIELH